MKPSTTGIDFQNTVKNTEDFNIFNYRNFYNGGGVAVGDINNDGLTDVFFTSNMESNRLYLNKGNWKFEDITPKAGIGNPNKWNTGVVMVDINNDGWLDIYVCNAGIDKWKKGYGNALYINNHDLSFTESAKEYGLDDSGYSTHAAFFDYDLDGDLDCYILNNSFIPVNTLNYANKREMRAEDWPVKDFLKGGGDKMLRNDNGHFIDVSKEANIYSSLIGFGLGVTIGDINNDNYPDIYVSNDFFEKDYLYINQKNGTFKEEIEQRMKHLSTASMGADMADINNDGYQEIFTTEMLPREEYRLKTTASFDNHYVFNLKKQQGFYNQYMQNCLQLNNQDGTFSEIANYANVAASDWSWGALMFDADNDGFNDIYVSNGIYHDVIDQDFIDFFASELSQGTVNMSQKKRFDEIIKNMPSRPITNNFFHNNKQIGFEEKSSNFGFTTPSFSNGAAYADLDNDGDLDLIINNMNMPSFVYQNKSETLPTKNNFIKISLKGEKKNTFAIGTKIEVFAEKQIFCRYNAPSRGFQSSTEYLQTIGLGTIKKIDSIRITWPDTQRVSLMKNPATNSKIVFDISQSQKRPKQKIIPEKTLFQPVFLAFEKHQEDNYEDYYKEKNIPMQLSLEGPKAAIGDVNNDGKQDVFIGGAKGQAGRIYLQTTNGFKILPQKIFAEMAVFEDTAAEFFDADNDGDQDLFVGSGGNQEDSSSNLYRNRLYFNDGKGNFDISPFSIPANLYNTSIVKIDDFDQDGDLDLFVGSRSVPLQFGVSPKSFLYQNNGRGIFSDITALAAPELLNLGMIRDAAFVDIDGDKQKELIIVGDWIAPTILKWQGKQLKKIKSNLQEYLGFWGVIHVVDIDNDNDNDLVLGNIGENFALRADKEHPLKLWINDFDKNGILDKFLTKTIEGQDIPVFLKRDVAAQFPFLKTENLKHIDYASKSIQDLFPSDAIKGSVIKTIDYRKSIIALNNGKGDFQIKALPNIAQISCINAIASTDIDKDGKIDLLLGGNFTHFIPQFGALDACRGTVLINKGKGDFAYVPNRKSGYTLDGDIKQIAQIKVNKQTYFINLVNNAKPIVYKINQ